MNIAVVGAGPAGAFCAERLAALGHRVDIYDPTHPREKPCGGGVTPGTFIHHPELREVMEAGNPVTTISMVVGDGDKTLDVDMPQPIYVYPREKLDGMLLERACKAGATHLRERVRRVRVEADVAIVETAGGGSATGGEERRYDFVVGADGTSSVVRRCLVGKRPGSEMSYASGGYHVEGLVESAFFIEFMPDYGGYFWVFPRGDHASVGMVAPVGKENAKGIARRVLEILERRYPGSGELPRIPYAASIPVADLEEAAAPTLGGHRFGLVGDAANLTDPITGEGIQHAIDSGALLAQCLDEVGPEHAAALYTQRWMEETGRDLLTCTRIAKYLYRPALVRLTLYFCGRSSRLRQLMVDCLMVMQPYSKMLRRVIADFTPFGDKSAHAKRWKLDG